MMLKFLQRLPLIKTHLPLIANFMLMSMLLVCQWDKFNKNTLLALILCLWNRNHLCSHMYNHGVSVYLISCVRIREI